MQKKNIKVNDIPTVIWGDPSDKLIIAIHGNMSNKLDKPIEILAKVAQSNAQQVLSFDLPEHGERKGEKTLCNVQNSSKELTMMMQYAKEHWSHISLFANSIGAYFALMSYYDEPIERAWFLSPVVDMLQLIERMMVWFQVSEERLEKEQIIATPIGQTLYWDYYCYVKEHPIVKWNTPTAVLYGSEDDTCEYETILQFKQRFPCDLEVIEGGEHFFHTPTQLQTFSDWLEKEM